jgi:hypothetical protein
LAVLSAASAIGCGGGSSDPDGSTGGTQSGANFAQNVQPIFNSRCTAGCHSGSTPQGGLDLSAGVSYASLVDKAASSACGARVPGAILVTPGNRQASMLWRKLANTGDKCFSAMPLGTGGLISVARTEFDTVEKWIQDGAQKN